MKTGRVVVLGPSYGLYPEAVAEGFRQNGLEARSFCFPDPAITPWELLSWRVLPAVGITAVRQTWADRTLLRVREACRGAGLLVIIKGDQVPLARYADLLEQVSCTRALWLMDSINNVKDGLQRASLVDVLFYFEGTDRSSVADLRVPCHHVPLATDLGWYHPIDGAERIWDVSFFGAFHDNRLTELESILTELPLGSSLEMRFAGPWRSRAHPIRSRRRIGRYPLTAQYLSHVQNWTHNQINLLNNQTSICLNVLHQQSVDSLNMRAFETCGSGAFLLCQSNAALSRSFAPGREVEAFDSPQDAAEKILFYLQHEDAARKIAAAGRDRVMTDHTFQVRTQEILSMIRADGEL
jgi:spore maturation protein CgeB